MENIWNEITEKLSFDRIRNVPVFEKFAMVEYIKLISREAGKAQREGIDSIKASDLYNSDNTYRLLTALVTSDEVTYNDMFHIIRNYLANFSRSDVYYAKFAILGIGALLMKKGYNEATIFNLLLSLLGEEFLTENFKLIGYNEALVAPVETESTIHYKEYEGKYRTTKYRILALTMLYQENPALVDEYILKHSEDRILILFYKMLKDVVPEARNHIVRRLYRTPNDYSQMVAMGLLCMFEKKNLMVSHYMMNSIIGKYSHYDQRPEKVRIEAENMKKEIVRLIEQSKQGV
ncbi:hypothetical protein [Guggenheimella bovis]